MMSNSSIYPSSSSSFSSSLSSNSSTSSFPLVDCHCHLSHSDFSQDLFQILSNAKSVGIGTIISVSENATDALQVLKIAQDYAPLVKPCVGIHPIQGDRTLNQQEFEEIVELIHLNRENIVGIGEIGLDFCPYFIQSPQDKQIQRECLRKQLHLAHEYQLPANVHSRSAGKPTIQLIEETFTSFETNPAVLFHAFDGKPSLAKSLCSSSSSKFFFSVPPSIERSPSFKKLVEFVPIDHLVLETDSPALGPQKGCRNEPKNLEISLKEIAKIKNMKVEEIAAITTKNACKIFPKIQSTKT